MTLFVTLLAASALAVLLYGGVLDAHSALLAVALAPCFFAGAWLGSRVFPHIDEGRFRRYTLIFLIVLSAMLMIT